MRAALVRGQFGVDRLEIGEDPLAGACPDLEQGELAAGQVAIRMRAASLNYRDLLVVRGEYDPRFRLPLTPCSDGVGVVEAVGPGGSRVAVGDRVCPIFAPGWLAGEPTREAFAATLGGSLPGVLRERVVLHESALVKPPAYLSDLEAATLPCAAVTAWNAVVELGRTRPGDVVLVQGTGGVALFALQIAKMCGARVVVTSKSAAKLERARALGADETIDYLATPGWGRAARELTGGRGVDLVIEVGGAGTLRESLRAVRHGGTVAVIGILAGASSAIDVLPILMAQIKLQGVFVGHRESFEAMNRAFSLVQLRPVLDATLPFEESRAAFERLASAEHFGKITVAF